MGAIDRICIIGAGNMGGAIAGGIFRNPEFSPGRITVTARTQETVDRVKAAYPGICGTTDNAAAAAGADLVVIAVKPWQIKDVIGEIRGVTDYGRCTVASVVAGVSFREMKEMFSAAPALLRIIPNTAIALGKSTTFIARDGVDDETAAEVGRLFGSMGEVIEVPEEMMPAGTALASCGIAYALKYIDAAIKGGVEIGFSAEESRRIVMKTVEGALALMQANGTMPGTEIDKVTTPGGYTFRGLSAMEEHGFSKAVLEGLLHSMR